VLSKSKRRLAERLKRPRQRRKEGLALVEGPRVVAEALRSGTEVIWGVVGEAFAASGVGRRLVSLASDRGVELATLPDDVVIDLADTEAPRPVLLIVRPRDQAEPSRLPPGRYLYLDGVQDPGNVGTLVRSAWAFGLAGVVVGVGTADPWSPKAVRSSAGGVFHVPFLTAPSDGSRQSWPGPLLYAEARRDTAEHVAAEVGASWVLAVGNEGAGVSDGVRALGRPVSLAMRAGVDSLNAGVAGSILMYVLTYQGLEPRPDPPRP